MKKDKRDKVAHPVQPLADDGTGVLRFKENKIVSYLRKIASDAAQVDMNKLAWMDFSDEDRVQFAQLIGYSLSGFGELDYVSDKDYARAAKMAPKEPTW